MLGASSSMAATIYPSTFYETRCRSVPVRVHHRGVRVLLGLLLVCRIGGVGPRRRAPRPTHAGHIPLHPRWALTSRLFRPSDQHTGYRTPTTVAPPTTEMPCGIRRYSIPADPGMPTTWARHAPYPFCRARKRGSVGKKVASNTNPPVPWRKQRPEKPLVFIVAVPRKGPPSTSDKDA